MPSIGVRGVGWPASVRTEECVTLSRDPAFVLLDTPVNTVRYHTNSSKTLTFLWAFKPASTETPTLPLDLTWLWSLSDYQDPCSEKHFGQGCLQQCQCGTGGFCNKTTGECVCKGGFTGTLWVQKRYFCKILILINISAALEWKNCLLLWPLKHMLMFAECLSICYSYGIDI